MQKKVDRLLSLNIPIDGWMRRREKEMGKWENGTVGWSVNLIKGRFDVFLDLKNGHGA